jgi:hypothetical protein
MDHIRSLTTPGSLSEDMKPIRLESPTDMITETSAMPQKVTPSGTGDLTSTPMTAHPSTPVTNPNICVPCTTIQGTDTKFDTIGAAAGSGEEEEGNVTGGVELGDKVHDLFTEAPLFFSVSDINRRIEVVWNDTEKYIATVYTFQKEKGEIYLIYDDGTCHWLHPTNHGFDSWRFITDGPVGHTPVVTKAIEIAKLTIKELEDRHEELNEEFTVRPLRHRVSCNRCNKVFDSWAMVVSHYLQSHHNEHQRKQPFQELKRWKDGFRILELEGSKHVSHGQRYYALKPITFAFQPETYVQLFMDFWPDEVHMVMLEYGQLDPGRENAVEWTIKNGDGDIVLRKVRIAEDRRK